MTVAEILDRALQAVGGGQADLSRAVGVSGPTVSRWYSGINKPDYESCLRLAKLTGIPAAEVLETAGHDASLLQGVQAPPLDEEEQAIRQLSDSFARGLRGVPKVFWPYVARASERLTEAFRDAPAPSLLPEDEAPDRRPTRASDQGVEGHPERRQRPMKPRELLAA